MKRKKILLTSAILIILGLVIGFKISIDKRAMTVPGTVISKYYVPETTTLKKVLSHDDDSFIVTKKLPRYEIVIEYGNRNVIFDDKILFDKVEEGDILLLKISKNIVKVVFAE